MSYKVGVKTEGDTTFVYNGLRFATREEAETYANDLCARWTAVQEIEVTESDDTPNHPK